MDGVSPAFSHYRPFLAPGAGAGPPGALGVRSGAVRTAPRRAQHGHTLCICLQVFVWGLPFAQGREWSTETVTGVAGLRPGVPISVCVGDAHTQGEAERRAVGSSQTLLQTTVATATV